VTDTAARLLDRVARYVDVPSLSGDEGALASLVEGELAQRADLELTRIGDNVVARTTGNAPSRVVVAGHLDTVPGAAGAIVAAGRVTGLGACDMKGSLAVMVELATTMPRRAHEVTWLFYACEEVARERSGLLEVLAARPDLLHADAAIVCEPTSAVVEAGCQGVVRARMVLRGVRAHTARPWRGRNAIQRLAAPLAAVAAYEPRRVELDGVTFAEQLQAVGVTGGVAGNVVPDEATLDLGLRVAPDRSTEEAAASLHELLDRFLEDGDELEILDTAEPAPPGLDHPVLAQLVALSGAPPRAKLGFTDVSTFAALGVPAANFGAGDPELAHHPGEFVDETDLVRCHDTLAALLGDAS
jgi:succinyl-diaminopimelate desuccinylase